jgi:hypothetical protein
MAKKAGAAGDAFAAATVLAWRLPMLWAMTLSPTPRRRAEAIRMVVEKSTALAEAAVGAQAALALSFLKPPSDIAADVMDAMAKPVRRRLNANARRVRSRRRI